MTEKDVLQPVDDAVRREGKTLIRCARFGALATVDPATGTPMASRVSLATSDVGSPVFLISQLSAHFGALENNPRASLLIGEPGKGDPLAHARVTVFGQASKIAEEQREWIRSRFLARHPKAELYVDFGDFAFWELKIEGASFNRGFGKAHQMQAEDLRSPFDDSLKTFEPGAVAHMNDDHLDAISLYATALLQLPEGPWRLACLDLEGLDLTCGDSVARLWFDPPLAASSELRPRLVQLVRDASGQS